MIKLCERCKVELKPTELKDVYKCPVCKGVVIESDLRYG
jgi:Zn-finger nucleic acid-binding protein